MKAPNEEWRAIDGWPYEVSNLGRVRYGPGHGICPGRLVKPIREYLRVRLYHEGKKSYTGVHLLVADAFLGPRAENEQVNHKNGDKGDPRLENLEVLTRNANQLHAIATGLSCARGSTHGRAKLTDEQVREIRREYQGKWGEQTATAKRYGISVALIQKVVSGALWGHLDPEYEPKKCLSQTLRGAGHGRAKLTPRRVRAMRRAFGKGVAVEVLAARYEMDRQIVRDIVYGKTWKDVV